MVGFCEGKAKHLVMTTLSLIETWIGHANMVAFATVKTAHIGVGDVSVCQLSIALLTSEIARKSNTVLICCRWAGCGPMVFTFHLSCHCRSVNSRIGGVS